MILHLSPGSGSIELHIHDDARVALYQPGERPAACGSRHGAPSLANRPAWPLGLVIGTLCLAMGYHDRTARFGGPGPRSGADCHGSPDAGAARQHSPGSGCGDAAPV